MGRMDVHESFRVQTSSMCSVGRWLGATQPEWATIGNGHLTGDRDRERGIKDKGKAMWCQRRECSCLR